MRVDLKCRRSVNGNLTVFHYLSRPFYPCRRFRVHIFREFVRTDKSRKQNIGGEAIGPGPGTIEIAVRRDHVVDDGFAQLNGLSSKLKSCINVSFVNELGLSEAGLDYGGLFKEFLTNLAKAAFDPG